jgi:hypothetical protein
MVSMNQTQLVQDYLSGLPIEEIGRRHHLKPNGIYYHLAKAGIEKSRRKRKYPCNDDLFSTDSEIGKYWLGFCEADAHVAENSIQFMLASRDRCMVEALQLALQTTHPIYEQSNGGFPRSRLDVTSDKLASDLLAFHPGTVSGCSRDLQHHLIRGLFDGDGSVSCHDYVYDGVKAYSRKITMLAELDTLEVIRDVVVSQAGTSKGCIRWARGIGEWSLSGIVNVQQFRDWLYQNATIFLPRKREAFTLLDREAKPRRRF